MPPCIRIFPIGTIDSIDIEIIRKELEKATERPTFIASSLPLPPDAWEGSRDQYRGEIIIHHLKTKHIHIDDDVLGIIQRDCYGQGLNFVFGQASMRTHTGFISLARLHEGYYNRPHDTAIYIDRILTECIHELGHMWGLGHCQNPRCVMHFSSTLADTDYKQARLCTQCRGLLHESCRRTP